MAETQELQLQIMVKEAKDAESNEASVAGQATVQHSRAYQRWIRIALHIFFVLSGQAAATLLGRQYYDKGGNSKWLATLVQLVGFPVLLPYYCLPPPKISDTSSNETAPPPSFLVLASVYFSLGLLIAADCFLYSVGLLYLPVSTYSLICASQLAFNSFFSFFLNKQKFTPFIINSLVLLTISSTLLVFQSDSENPTGLSKVKYIIGFICTVGASAGFGLVLSLTQLTFQKVLKKETFTVIMDMIVYTSLVASCATMVGLLVSKEFKSLKTEMGAYKLGKISYVMNLVWTAICWQVFNIGATGLIFETSSLFSNAISVLGLPLVPILAVVFFHDKMGGIKVIAMLLALWGFLSFLYQQYLDDYESKNEKRKADEVVQASDGSQ
ncbi:probable purine permease 10 [Mangifera indica]|uniref:probable purine permease 10 n=1 Tax=Mangifera indica TaxID=29780 RepID=UPI001CFAA222|nr:probable purine permease 10 [Mangifera indica]